NFYIGKTKHRSLGVQHDSSPTFENPCQLTFSLPGQGASGLRPSSRPKPNRLQAWALCRRASSSETAYHPATHPNCELESPSTSPPPIGEGGAAYLRRSRRLFGRRRPTPPYRRATCNPVASHSAPRLVPCLPLERSATFPRVRERDAHRPPTARTHRMYTPASVHRARIRARLL